MGFRASWASQTSERREESISQAPEEEEGANMFVGLMKVNVMSHLKHMKNANGVIMSRKVKKIWRYMKALKRDWREMHTWWV